MKFYQVNKSLLHWTEMIQLNYKWQLPILIDDEMNVLAGNSLKDNLPDKIFVIMRCKNELLMNDLVFIETKIAEENDEKRLDRIQIQIREYLKEVRKPVVEYDTLFDFKETRCITEERYIKPRAYNFEKHSKKRGGTETEYEIEVDMEIMKELM